MKEVEINLPEDVFEVLEKIAKLSELPIDNVITVILASYLVKVGTKDET